MDEPDLHPGRGGIHLAEAEPSELALLGASHCQLERREESRALLRIGGRLPRGWSVRLSRGLARRGVSLVSGDARRVQDDAWLLELELDLRHADASGIDFLAVARSEEETGPVSDPRILDFALQLERDALHLEVHAWDAVGLLAAVLAQVWSAGLSPDELILETEAECAFHSLVLRDRHRAPPTASHARLLARALKRLQSSV